ncbi:hypothetical protein SAMN05660330_04275 [Desulforhopalus singaporensis]|uniref:Transposase n=1 Tax=Desulforhopalus singaporensis TaxID=91360 RepID=A0A1H0VWW0_9BACT|nr:hypothetical protein SAMN05660330_04275 [Desulforhopalus singaporensis]
METIHYIGLDVLKKTVCYCVKTYQGETIDQGTVFATRPALHWSG